MKNLIKNCIRVVKKNTIREEREPVTMRCGSVVSTLIFKKRKDGRVKAEVTYHTDHSIVPVVRDIEIFDDDSQSNRPKEIR